jgi:outer membrane lipoprotein SlyB
MKIKLATVLDVREVQIEAQNSSVGATTGATVGAIAGSTSGKHGAIQGIAGAVIGGVAGSLVERGASQKNGVEITYQLDGSKELEAMVQEKDDQDIKPGDRIRLVQSAFNVRAVKVVQGVK